MGTSLSQLGWRGLLHEHPELQLQGRTVGLETFEERLGVKKFLDGVIGLSEGSSGIYGML